MSRLPPFKHAFVALGALALSGCAGDRLAEHAVNTISEGWYTWGNVKAEVVTDASAPGGKYQRVAVPVKPANWWDDGVVATVVKPVRKVDVIVFAFWARAEALPGGNDFIELSGRVAQSGPSPAALTPEANFLLSRQWKLFYSSGTAEQDVAGGTAGGSMIIGSDVQTIDFGPVYISDFGPKFDVSKLKQLKAQNEK